MRFLLLFILISASIQATAADNGCRVNLNPFWTDARTSPQYNFVRDGASDYMGYASQNSAFLREFFGPQKNTFHEWFSWLQSDEPGPPPNGLPGLYYANGHYTGPGMVVLRRMEYPIDMGLGFSSHPDQMGMDLLHIPVRDVKHLRGSSDEAKKGQKALMHKLNMQLFGVYYAKEFPVEEEWVNWVHWHPGLSAAEHFTTEFRVSPYIGGSPSQTLPEEAVPYRTVEYVTEDGVPGVEIVDKDPQPEVDWDEVARLQKEKEEQFAKDRGDPLEDLKQVIDVVNVDHHSNTILIKVPLGSKNKPKNRNQEVIKQMFFITYWQMVQKAYRESGLFEDSLETALTLIDDFIATMENSSDDQNLYLMYDLGMWQRIVFRMSIANNFVQVKDMHHGWQPYQYQSIPDVFWPFYPIFGVTTEKYPTGEIELKRLFDNRDPDPLNIFHSRDEEYLWPKDVNKLFFDNVAMDLQHETDTFVVVSITAGHTALYRRMGFKIEKEEPYEAWGVTKTTLRQDVDDYFAKKRNRYVPPEFNQIDEPRNPYINYGN